MQNVLILPILTIFLISGCASTKQLEIFTKEIERTPLNLELPPVETLEQVNLIIITSDNQEEVFAKMKEQNIDPVIFGYSDEDWELVAKNNVNTKIKFLISFSYISILLASTYKPFNIVFNLFLSRLLTSKSST